MHIHFLKIYCYLVDIFYINILYTILLFIYLFILYLYNSSAHLPTNTHSLHNLYTH